MSSTCRSLEGERGLGEIRVRVRVRVRVSLLVSIDPADVPHHHLK